MPRLQEKYIKEVRPAMREKFGYKNDLAVPRIEKVIINTGFGRLISGKASDEQKKISENIVNDLSLITGQKAVPTKAKKSISAFKIREGMALGAAVTLRKKRMYDFLDRLINIALPRSRDFRGIEQRSVDQSGNLTVGIKEQIVFPEISTEKSRFIFGFEAIVVSTAKSQKEGIELFKLMGFPIK